MHLFILFTQNSSMPLKSQYMSTALAPAVSWFPQRNNPKPDQKFTVIHRCSFSRYEANSSRLGLIYGPPKIFVVVAILECVDLMYKNIHILLWLEVKIIVLAGHSLHLLTPISEMVKWSVILPLTELLWLLLITSSFVVLCHVLLSPTQVLTLRYIFSPLPGVNVSCVPLLCASVTHTFVCSPNHQKKEKCWHFDRSFDSIFLYIHKMQMWQTFQIPEMAGLLCFPPPLWDVSGDSIKRRSPRKPNAWSSCSSVFKQQWGRAGR